MIRAIIASTIVLGLAGLLATLAHRASASVRHAIWFVGLGAALGVGALAAIGPVVEVESTLVNGGGGAAFPRESIQSTAQDLGAVASAAAQVAPAPGTGIRIPTEYLLLAAWLTGVAIIVGRAILAHVAVGRLIARSSHLDVELRLE